MDNTAPPPSPTPPPTLADIRRRYFGPLLAGLLLLRLVTLFIWLGGLIPDYPDVTFPEGALVARALDVARGHTPYQDWRQWPHAFAPYPPLAYYPAGWLARGIFGSPSAHEVYLAGRAFCFVMVVGIAVLIYLFARQLGLSRVWSLLAVAALGECQVLMEYCTSFRPDAPKTFFSLLALYLLVRCRPGWRTLAGALAALYLSLWFKPTAWAVSLILAWWTWRHFGLRRAAAVGAAFVAAGLIPLFLLNHRWHGALLLNIVDSLRNGATLNEVRNFLSPGDLYFQAIFLAGIVGALSGIRWVKKTENRIFFAAIPLALVVGLSQMLKVGADVNYQLETFALSAVATVWGLARWWRNEDDFSYIALALGIIPLLSVWRILTSHPATLVDNPQGLAYCFLNIAQIICLALWWWKSKNVEDRSPVMPRWREAALWLFLIPLLLVDAYDNFAKIRDDFAHITMKWAPPPITAELIGTPGPILTTNPFVALQAPAPTVMDYFQYDILCRRGSLSTVPLLEKIRRREFPVVVLSQFVLAICRDRQAAFCCAECLPTLMEHYKITRWTGVFIVLKPLAPGESPQGGIELLFNKELFLKRVPKQAGRA